MDEARKILAIDDNPSIRSSMQFIFPSPPYEMTAAEDVDEALVRLSASSDQYDVIIVDQKMPRLTGLDLVQEIRQRGITGKIMVLSAHLTPEIREAYEQMEVELLLDKPFDIHKLRSELDKLAA